MGIEEALFFAFGALVSALLPLTVRSRLSPTKVNRQELKSAIDRLSNDLQVVDEQIESLRVQAQGESLREPREPRVD